MSNTVKEGWLKKQSRYLNKWRDRWTVLTQTAISTYKQKQVYKNATETLLFADIKSVKKSRTFSAMEITIITTGNSKFKFQTNEHDIDEWFSTINAFANQIKIPIRVEGDKNADYHSSFFLSVPYYKDYNYSINQLISDIMQRVNKQYKSNKIIPKKIANDSFTEKEVNSNWDDPNALITNYPKNRIKQYGIHLFIDLAINKPKAGPNNQIFPEIESKHDDEDELENVLSLSDDEFENEEDKLTHLGKDQQEQLIADGYCMCNTPMQQVIVTKTVTGYIRVYFDENCMVEELIKVIIRFYCTRYNPKMYILLWIGTDKNEENDNTQYFLVPKINTRLSGLLSNAAMVDDGNGFMIEKVRADVMHHVLRYLGHHRGTRPEEIAKPIRSVKMERIVADEWDAHYINSFTKKVIFQIILAANYLDCPSLLHLGCAKIATLIKGKSPEEIKNILADNDGGDEEKDKVDEEIKLDA